MTLNLNMITIDSTDPTPLARWWAEQLGATIVEENDGWFYIMTVPGWPQGIAVQKVEEVAPGKNRFHLDLGSDDPQKDVARFVDAGAKHIAEHTLGEFGWSVLADPEGNQFCVSPNH